MFSSNEDMHLENTKLQYLFPIVAASTTDVHGTLFQSSEDRPLTMATKCYEIVLFQEYEIVFM